MGASWLKVLAVMLAVIAIERDRWVIQIYISTATDCDFIQDFLTTWEVTVYSR